MRKFLILLGIIGAALALTAAATAADTERTRTTITIDRTFLAPLFTNACGFPVYRTNATTFEETDIYDSSGNLVEIDFRNHGPSTITLMNPATGKSLTSHNAWQTTLLFNADGSVTQKSSGMFWNFTAPGLGTMLQISGHWVVDANGDFVFEAGVDNFDDNIAAFCDYLATP